MKIQSLIKKKIARKELNSEEISFLVKNYTEEKISDLEMINMLKVFEKMGMTEKETLMIFEYNYKKMEKIKLQNVAGFKIDKHSSGGVGDKITLILLPILAALGFKVFKFSGGRLKFTGGTIEKLSSFENINLKISQEKFINKCQTEEIVLAEINQNICKFEEKIYRLRNSYQGKTVIGLIVNSIMIKKMFCQNDGLILDVKIGSGAFFKTLAEGEKFAQLVLKIANKYNYKTSLIFTAMNSPLGAKIGNKLEIWEVIDFLSGKKKRINLELKEMISKMVHEAFLMKEIKQSLAITSKKIEEVIKNGQGLEKLKTFIEKNGGNFTKFYQTLQPKVNYQLEIKSWKEGYINFVNTKKIGQLTNQLNLTKNNQIDYEGGIFLLKITNDFVKKGESLAILYTNNERLNNYQAVLKIYQEAVKINPQPIRKTAERILKIARNF